MSGYTIGIVGTGPHPDESEHDGYSMGYRHARSSQTVDGCELVACADIVSDNACDFGHEFGLTDEQVFTDIGTMLDVAEPDIVAICTPPTTHADLVELAASHDAVQAIHCEKPMAATFADSQRLVEVCTEHDVQLTVNLQHRCSDAAREVKTAIDEGAIGDLKRIEFGRQDLLQTGLHHVDLANYVMDDEPVEWVLGQIDYPEEHIWYTDMHSENQSLGMWEYRSGVHAICSTGAAMDAIGAGVNRFIGTEGEIAFELSDKYRIRTTSTDGWTTVEVSDNPPQDRAIAAVVNGLVTDEEPENSGQNALGATEIVFSIWESARRRGRVNLPLEIEDNPLEALIESGELPPNA